MMIRGREAWGPVLMMGLLQSALIACLPWLIERTDLSPGNWSLILSAGMVPVLVGGPWWGRRVDRYGAQRVSALASVMVLAGFALVLVVLGVGAQGALAAVFLLVARLVHGVGVGGVFPAAQRLAVADAGPGEWSYRLSRLQMAVHAGRLAGPALILLAAWLGVMMVLVVAGVVAVLLVAGNRRARRQRETAGQAPSVEAQLPWRPGLPFYLMALTLTAGIGALQFVLGPVLTRMAGVSAEVGSSLTAMALVLTSLVGLLFGPLVHARVRADHVLTAIWGGALLLAGVVLASAQSVPAVYGGIALLAFGAAVLTPWYGSGLRQCHPAAQGEVAGRLTSTHTLGYILGTLAGGWLLEARPDHALMMFAVLAPVLLLLAGWVLKGRSS